MGSRRSIESSNWHPSGDKNADEMHFLESGDMSDCTLQVGSRSFKCHKFVLGRSSAVLKNKFYGEFRGDEEGNNETFVIDHDISPRALESTLKFIYGNKKEFENFNLGLQVYRFAHKMQMYPLIRTLENEFFDGVVNAKNVFALFDFCVEIDNRDMLEKCWKILHWKTKEALESASWKSLSLEAAKVFLRNDHIVGVSEFALLNALISWGTARQQRCDQSERGDQELRSAIDPCLKLIRFAAIDSAEFAAVCLNDRRHLLSAEEKNKIFQGISLKSWALFPEEFSRKGRRCARKYLLQSFSPFNYWGNS